MVKCHCGKYACFNNIGEKNGIFCSKHKLPNMVDVKSSKCQKYGCNKQPKFNEPGQKNGRFCIEHCLPNMIDVENPTCEMIGCLLQPNFNNAGGKKARFCLKHKLPNMVDIRHPPCEENNCKTRPSFNNRGEKKGRFCSKHKLPNMVDVTKSTCEENGCEKIPSFNNRGEKKGRFCSKHKLPNMVDIKHPPCEENGCLIRPFFNNRGEKKGRFCSKHKLEDMINVIDPTCEKKDCSKQPHFNFSGEKKGRFCSEHKLENMTDVKKIFCKESNCEITSLYGWLGKGKTYCAQHRKKGMVRYPNRKCSECYQLGTYEENGIRFCQEHKSDKSKNLGIDTCSICGLDDILFDKKCSSCNPESIKSYIHAKENRVKDLLKSSNINFIHDRMLEGPVCGRERPDFQIDCGTHFVYIEVDENQHNSYPCECEQIRMINLTEVRGIPVRWIRYNPDIYDPPFGKKIVKIEQREKKLIEYIKWSIKKSPKETGCISNVLYLFYDEYETGKEEWNKLL